MFQPKQVVRVKSLDAIERGIILHSAAVDALKQMNQLRNLKIKQYEFNKDVTLIEQSINFRGFWKVDVDDWPGTWLHHTWFEPTGETFKREYHCEVNPHINKGCQHANKSMKIFQTFKYMYCPDCKKAVT